MKFTQFFAVAVLATTLTASAFAMDEKTEGAAGMMGSTSMEGMPSSDMHQQYSEQVKSDLDYANNLRDQLNGKSAAESVMVLLGKLSPVSPAIKKIFDTTSACKSTDLSDLKACVKTIAPVVKGNKNLLKVIGTALNVGCSGNIWVNTCGQGDARKACGVVACNIDPSYVKNCMSKNKDDCKNYMD